MPLESLNRKYRIIAGAGNYEDFLAVLDELASNASDIRTPLSFPGETEQLSDSLEIRKAINRFLQRSIDDIKRIRKNELEKLGESVNDES